MTDDQNSPSMPSIVSPLTEADPRSLDEFMSRDPFGYSRIDRNEMVRILRAQRANWERLEATGKRQPKASKVAAPTATGLEDLGLTDL